MPFESVSIHETYELITPIGSLWRKIEATYKIDPDSEDEYIARDKVKAFLDESHKKYFPELPSATLPKGDLYFNETTRKYEK